MGPSEWTAVASAAVAAIPVMARVCWRQRMAWRQMREQARCDHIRRLPPGSRVLDLGRHGMVIEVGGRDDGEAR